MFVRADVGLCQGYGNCAAADEEHFDVDDDGLVVVLRAEVAESEQAAATAAVRSCPVRAIWLEDADGSDEREDLT